MILLMKMLVKVYTHAVGACMINAIIDVYHAWAMPVVQRCHDDNMPPLVWMAEKIEFSSGETLRNFS